MPSPDAPTNESLPPLEQRRVITMGLAHVAKKSRVVYDWSRIRDLWLIRPETSLLTFAQWLEIPYSSIKKQDEFNLEEKLAITEAAATTWRDQMVKQLAVRSFGDDKAAAVSTAQAIRDMQETTTIAASYARGRLVKVNSEGRVVANAMLPPAEVDRLMSIISKCSNTLRNLVEIGRAARTAREDLQTEPVARQRLPDA